MARRRRLDPRRPARAACPATAPCCRYSWPKRAMSSVPHAQAESAHRHALLARLPRRVRDAERFEQPRAQIIEHRLAGHLLHDRRQHVAGGRVVDEERPRLVRDRPRQEGFARRSRPTGTGISGYPRRDGRSTSSADRARASPSGWCSAAAGASSGKNFSTGSSTVSLPSATARPTAVDVKLLLSENIMCGSFAA